MSDMTVQDVLAYLRKRGSKRNVDGMARYGIVAPKVFGVSVGTLRDLGKKIGRDHTLALARGRRAGMSRACCAPSWTTRTR